MYRQGLGDCFLLSIPKAEGQACHVLIDCGVLTGTADAARKMRKVAQNIADETNRRLDVLAVTHEHWDHTSGFVQARDILQQVQVGEVWVAWTEKPGDALADELASTRANARKAVAAAARRLRATGAGRTGGSASEGMEGLLAFFGPFDADGRPTTAQAMDWVKSRPNATIRYCEPGGEPMLLPGLDDLRVFVLGPPRDKKLIGKSDPSKRNSEVYGLAAGPNMHVGFLAAVDALENDTDVADQPFADWFGLKDEEARNNDFLARRYWSTTDKWRRIEDDWLDTAEGLSLRLDSDTNNTSLVLAFELGSSKQILLFPGDAQVGNWLSWSNLSWNVQDTTGQMKTIRIEDLLARTILYKVGHHGSHNATLRERGLELMTSGNLAAMLPVSRETAAKQGRQRKDGTRGWLMPLPSLYTRLQEKTSGRILDRDLGVQPPAGPNPEWDSFVSRTNVQPDWIDYHINL
jgi:metallo-beta-lactamase superfamily protein